MSRIQIDWKKVPSEFVFIDLETTGLNAEESNILEIGALRFSKQSYLESKQVESFQAIIRQNKPIPKKIIEITGIDDSLAESGEELDLAFSDFIDFIGKSKLVAYNADFDKDFLIKTSKQTGIHLPKPLIIECALTLARERITKVESYKLTSLANHFNIDTSNAHRALGDCLMGLKVYLHCLSISSSELDNGKLAYNEADDVYFYVATLLDGIEQKHTIWEDQRPYFLHAQRALIRYAPTGNSYTNGTNLTDLRDKVSYAINYLDNNQGFIASVMFGRIGVQRLIAKIDFKKLD